MKRILVVDDVQLICTLCHNTLTDGGYEVVTQLSGARCLSYLKTPGEEPVDLVILDVEMPYMSGFQTLARIREIPELKELPVMFLTSSCTKETVAKAIELGAVDYLKKPFKEDELIRRVRNIFKSKEPPAEEKKEEPEQTDQAKYEELTGTVEPAHLSELTSESKDQSSEQ